MLEEAPTDLRGKDLLVADVLAMLEPDQWINGLVNHDPSTPLTGDERSTTHHRDGNGTSASNGIRCAFQVVNVNSEASQLLLTTNQLPDVADYRAPVRLDFTDMVGTYFIEGTLDTIHRERLSPTVTTGLYRATLVQLRRFVRVPVRITPRIVEIERESGKWAPIHVDILDLSVGGMGMLAPQPVPHGARIQATFPLPGRLGELLVRGRIVVPPGIVEARGGARRRTYRFGMEFSPLENENLKRLQRALHLRQLELRRIW